MYASQLTSLSHDVKTRRGDQHAQLVHRSAEQQALEHRERQGVAAQNLVQNSLLFFRSTNFEETVVVKN